MSPSPSAPIQDGSRTVSRRERRKESRPGELLDAALDLFVEHGFAATRLEDIAARAGVSKGTLYLYFDSKEALFQALVRRNLLPLIERFRLASETSELPSAVLIERTLRGWWVEFGGTRLAGLAKLVVSEAGNFPEVARFFDDEVVRPTHALLAAIVGRGIARGEFRPVDLEAAAYLWLSPLALKAIWMHALPEASRLEPDRLIAVHLDLILHTLRPVPR